MKREDLRTLFDEVAETYDEVRPGYPEATIVALYDYARLTDKSRVLELGCGTGQATLPVAKCGAEVLALELGPALAERAAENLKPFPKVTVLNIAFEDWTPQEDAFDLFLSAQAFHWIEPEFGLGRAALVLKPGGTLALMWQLDVSQTTDFYQATNPVYDHYFQDKSFVDKKPMTAWVTLFKERLLEHPDFENLQELRHPRHLSYDKEAYLKLLSTNSDNRLLDEDERVGFYQDIAAVIDDFGGEVTRRFETVLLLSRRC